MLLEHGQDHVHRSGRRCRVGVRVETSTRVKRFSLDANLKRLAYPQSVRNSVVSNERVQSLHDVPVYVVRAHRLR